MDFNITRRVALCQLLEMPDPPELHRGHVRRMDGKPNRHEMLPLLAEAFARGKMLEFRLRHIVTH
ncbi:MAG: hypothetical protein ABL961_03890 [Vicinamibacterales bacterium]